MTVPPWLEPVLRFGIWLLRPKYLAAVFPICIDNKGRVLIIRKRLGPMLGWQLPGGSKDYDTSLEWSACSELLSETGLMTAPESLELVRVQCVEEYRDLNFAYLVKTWQGDPSPRDVIEIAEARWVLIVDAYDMLYIHHRPMLMAAVAVAIRSGRLKI